ncbi:hypothetical protein GCM10010985_38570 [Caballeronia grimmiae]|uniref:Uncharacterized protein n=1 Tax=Caballeronia grimmiae TaxID=1071679 RepID=A0ABQ1RTL8_9BURK|nr:hypothetical protein GCM10010985_38570 [Caballeronia grimmiae]
MPSLASPVPASDACVAFGAAKAEGVRTAASHAIIVTTNEKPNLSVIQTNGRTAGLERTFGRAPAPPPRPFRFISIVSMTNSELVFAGLSSKLSVFLTA